MLQAAGMVLLEELTNIMNDKIYGEKYLKTGKVVLPICKDKGDAMECGKCRGVSEAIRKWNEGV